MNQEASSDTLIFENIDFEIGNSANIEVIQGNLNTATGEVKGENFLFKQRGQEFRGKRAFLNDPYFIVEIYPSKPELIKMGQGNNLTSQLNVITSVPKIYHRGNNLQPVSQSQAAEALTFVQKELKKNDIHCNIFKGTPTRLDVFKNVYNDEPLPTYAPIFNVLNGSRAKDKTTYGATGYLFKNTVTQYAIYDKVELMIKNKIDVSGYPKNISRFEQRFMDKRKIQRATGFYNVSELLKRYKELPELYEKGWKSEIFKYEAKDVLIKYAKQIESELIYFMLDEYGNINRNWQQKHLQMKGLQYIVENEGKDIYRIALQNVLSELYEKQNTINVKIKRAMNKLDEVAADLEMIKQAKPQDKTILTLYNELRGKLFSSVA